LWSWGSESSGLSGDREIVTTTDISFPMQNGGSAVHDREWHPDVLAGVRPNSDGTRRFGERENSPRDNGFLIFGMVPKITAYFY
jgi:hypothetical protein